MYHTIIVEDDPMVASINQKYLENFPQFHLEKCFSNGREAIAFLEKHPADLAIVDYYMPEMNGLEFARSCRQNNSDIVIIMITAASSSKEFSDVMCQGVLDYIVKPFTQQRFASAIEKFLNVKNTLSSGLPLGQEDIDRLISAAPSHISSPDANTKGIQIQTLTALREYLAEHRDSFLTNNEIALDMQLSRITVRRYMNYLLETNEITSQIDYATGGRPSIRYRLISP